MHGFKLCLAIALALPAWPLLALPLNEEEAAGRQIFLEGISPSGAQIHARVGGSGITLPGSASPCGNCHGRDGRGRPEGGVNPPDITWRRLTAPYGQRQNGRIYPAYDEAALALAITEGRDSAGNQLDPAMPRFVMSPRDLHALTAYLKRLQDDHDPGVMPERLLLGCAVPSTGALADLGRTVELMLRAALEQINEAGGVHGRRLELVVVDAGTDRNSAEAALQRLANDEQVFAVLAPLMPALEGRMATLLAESQTPLFSMLTPSGTGEAGPLVFEVLPGLREQLLALADFAKRDLDGANREVLILHGQGEHFSKQATSLLERLRADGWQHVRQGSYPDMAQSPSVTTAQVIFFLGNNAAFHRLATELQAADKQPFLLASSNQVAGAVQDLPPAFSGRVFLAYPFVPDDWSEQGIAQLQRVRQRAGLGSQYMAFQVGALVTVQLLAEGLRRAGRDLSRERLIKAVRGLQGYQTGLTPAIEFTPGRSVGVAGAHIVAINIGSEPYRPIGGFLRLSPD